MKEFLIDLCLVGLFLFVINSTFNNHSIEKTLFDREINEFEQDIQNEEVINSEYGTTSDDSENGLSLVVKSISDLCLSIIEIIILIISNFISMLL